MWIGDKVTVCEVCDGGSCSRVCGAAPIGGLGCAVTDAPAIDKVAAARATLRKLIEAPPIAANEGRQATTVPSGAIAFRSRTKYLPTCLGRVVDRGPAA